MMIAGCNDTSDLAPPSPETPWPIQPAESSPGNLAAPHTIVRVQREEGEPAVDSTHVYSLAELIDLAQRRNKETRIAWEQARQAALGVGIARADALPELTVNALGGYQRLALPFPSTFVRQGYITANAEEVFPELAIRYLLLDFGRRTAREEGARQLSLAANNTFTGAHQILIMNVARAYFTLDGVNAALRAAEAARDTARLLLQAAQARQARGVGTRIDTALARRGAAQADYDVAAAVAAQHAATYRLLETLDLPPLTKLRVQDSSDRPLPRGTGQTVDEMMANALRQRPDLIADLARLRSSEAGIALARAQLAPTLGVEVNVQGNVGQINVNGSSYNSVTEPQAGAFLAFRWPLYQGGLRRNQLRIAESQRNAANDVLEEGKDRAMHEVALAYDQLQTQLDQYDAAVALETAARIAFDAAMQTYTHGVGTFTDAATAQAKLAEARADRAHAHAQALIDAAGLAFASGELTSATAPALDDSPR